MVASSREFTTSMAAKLPRVDVSHAYRNGFVEFRKKKRKLISGVCFSVKCCCSDSTMPIRGGGSSRNGVDKGDDWRFDAKKISANYMRIQASSAMPFASPQSRFVSKPEKFFSRCIPRNPGPQSRESPPKRDTGIANEKDWGISLLNDNVNETGINEDGSTWYRESGEDLGDNGYRCRWTKMGGQSSDGTLEWKETCTFLVGVWGCCLLVYNHFLNKELLYYHLPSPWIIRSGMHLGLLIIDRGYLQ